MKNVTKEIEDLIKKPIEEIGIKVHSVEYTKENNHNFLKITLDKVNGLDLDQVVEATNIINPILDDNDLIKDEYILDVSSKERGES